MGIAGLDKDYSPGRPSMRKEKLIPHFSEYLAKSPREFGWGEDVWTVKVLRAQFEKKYGHTISRHTIIRALHDAGFISKRTKKTMPTHAPGKEEKLQRVQEIAADILELRSNENVEVIWEESHFSTAPYVIQGWSKRGRPLFPPDSTETRELHDI